MRHKEGDALTVDELPHDVWPRAYEEVLRALPDRAARTGVLLCGMSANVDARIDMHDMPALLSATHPPEAVELATLLKRRAAEGLGGELRLDWRGGPTWLSGHVRLHRSLGGTGPQAAWVLSMLGCSSVVALEDRSTHMLAQWPPGIGLIEDGVVVEAGKAKPRGESRPDIFIFEFTAGARVADVTPPRSSRIIVRFDDLGIEKDDAFDAATPRLAIDAASGLVSGFNNEPADGVAAAADRVFALARAWLAAGLETVHLELAGYATRYAIDRVLEGASGCVTSIGMSQSELNALAPASASPEQAMIGLGERLGVNRVCVHADHWAASVTRGDPMREREALITGCLLASARAGCGTPVRPEAIDAAARFQPLPFGSVKRCGGWTFVACPSPYLDAPVTTLGLGDTFTAGCLLALGRHARAPANLPPARPG